MPRTQELQVPTTGTEPSTAPGVPCNRRLTPVCLSPVSLSLNAAVSVTDPADLDANSVETPSNSANRASNPAGKQLTSIQSGRSITAESVSNTAVCVTNTAELHLTSIQQHSMLSSLITPGRPSRINHQAGKGEGGGGRGWRVVGTNSRLGA